MSLAWGGYQNGEIPQSVLVAVGKSAFGEVQYLEASAARAYFALDAAFYRQFHKHLVVNAGNRPLPEQKELYAAYQAHPATNALAAYPGTSNHGWARACDFGSNTQYAGTPEALWLEEHGPDYGFWPTGYGFPKVEPWHYDFTPGTATASLDITPITEHEPTQEEIDEMAATKGAAIVRDYLRDGRRGVFLALIYPDGTAVKMNGTEDVNSGCAAHVAVYGLPRVAPVDDAEHNNAQTIYGTQLTDVQWQWFWYYYAGPMTGFADEDFPAGRRPTINGKPKGQ